MVLMYALVCLHKPPAHRYKLVTMALNMMARQAEEGKSTIELSMFTTERLFLRAKRFEARHQS